MKEITEMDLAIAGLLSAEKYLEQVKDQLSIEEYQTLNSDIRNQWVRIWDLDVHPNKNIQDGYYKMNKKDIDVFWKEVLK